MAPKKNEHFILKKQKTLNLIYEGENNDMKWKKLTLEFNKRQNINNDITKGLFKGIITKLQKEYDNAHISFTLKYDNVGWRSGKVFDINDGYVNFYRAYKDEAI
jgi:hypothetical protein